MPAPSRHTLAVIGAGPIGLEAAARALELGLDVHVFERGEIGAHLLAWGHVPLFTPWSMNVGPASARLLARHGWTPPDGATCPTGADMVARLLAPLAATPELRERIHTHSQVAHVSRRRRLKADAIGRPERAAEPFRLLVRQEGWRENVLHAFHVVDASGTYGSPNWAGTGGIPARGEIYLAPQMSYRCDDVAGLRRERHANRTTLVIGGGATAATTVTALARLADEFTGTRVTWATREDAGALPAPDPADPLGARRELLARAAELRGGAHPAVSWLGGVEVEGFEFNSATHRYRVQLLGHDDQARVVEADEVVVNTGFGPDDSLYRELQVHECWASRGPMKLASALLDSGTADCLDAPPSGAELLRNPEPGFWILGSKSYGRHNTFLLATGYGQVESVLPVIARESEVSFTG
jgi:thioredoxin reductase